MSKKNTFRLVFLPGLFLTFLLGSSHVLLFLARTSLIGSEISYAKLPALQSMVLIPSIFAVILLLVSSIKWSFEKVMRWALLLIIVGILTVTAILPWSSLPFYLFTSLIGSNFLYLFVWGFINQRTTAKEGIKAYIPLVFLIGLGEALAGGLGLLIRNGQDLPLLTMVLPSVALLGAALWMFNWAWKNSHEIFDQKESSGRFPYLSAAYLLSGALMIKSLLNLLLKTHLKTLLTEPQAYSSAWGHFASLTGVATILASFLWLGLGTLLLAKKGWRATATCGSISIFLGALLFILFPPLSKAVVTQALLSGFLVGTTTGLFFALVQIAYLYLPLTHRFRAKVVTEMILAPLFKSFPNLLIQGLIVTFGSLKSTTPFVKIFILLFLILLVVASRRKTPSSSPKGELVN